MKANTHRVCKWRGASGIWQIAVMFQCCALARPICHLAPELSDLPWTGVVTLAGASVRWEGGLLYRCTMPIDLLQETMDCLWREKIEFILQGDEEYCFVGAGEVSSPKTVRAEKSHASSSVVSNFALCQVGIEG